MYFPFAESVPITDLLGVMGNVFTFVVAKFVDILNIFTSNALLLLFLGLTITSAIISLATRLYNRRG